MKEGKRQPDCTPALLAAEAEAIADVKIRIDILSASFRETIDEAVREVQDRIGHMAHLLPPEQQDPVVISSTPGNEDKEYSTQLAYRLETRAFVSLHAHATDPKKTATANSPELLRSEVQAALTLQHGTFIAEELQDRQKRNAVVSKPARPARQQTRRSPR